MTEETGAKLTMILIVALMISVIAGNVAMIFIAAKDTSRDLNNDGVVDIVDLSIMASEIAERNAQK